MQPQKNNVSHLSDAELDAAIAKKQGRDPSQLSDAELDAAIAAKTSAKAPSGLDTEALKVGIEKGATFGARPFVAGLGAGAGSAYGALAEGQGLSEAVRLAKEGFSEGRVGAQKEQEMLAARSPLTSAAGEIGGTLLVPGAAIKTITGGAKGMLAAARVGSAMGLGDALGNASSVGEGIEKTGMGAAMGPLAELGANRLGAGANAIARKLDKSSAGNAIKAAGAMLKDYRQLNGKGKVQEFGKFLTDNGLVKAGDTVESVAAKSGQLKADAGKAIDSIYNYARNRFGSQNLPGLNLARQKDEILSIAAKDLGHAEGKEAALGRLSKYIDERVAEHGDVNLDPKTANEIKGAIDDVINYARDPLKKDPVAEQAFSSARKYVSKQIDDSVEAIGKMTGSEQLMGDLKEANKVYGNAKQATQIARDREMRLEANNALGLRQSILMGGGATAGGVTAAIQGGDPADILTGMAGGAAAGASLKTIERYGPAILAQAEAALAKQIGESATLRRMIAKNPQLYQDLLKQTADKYTGPGGVPTSPAVYQNQLSGETP